MDHEFKSTGSEARCRLFLEVRSNSSTRKRDMIGHNASHVLHHAYCNKAWNCYQKGDILLRTRVFGNKSKEISWPTDQRDHRCAA